jgi:hypothetical protein
MVDGAELLVGRQSVLQLSVRVFGGIIEIDRFRCRLLFRAYFLLFLLGWLLGWLHSKRHSWLLLGKQSWLLLGRFRHCLRRWLRAPVKPGRRRLEQPVFIPRWRRCRWRFRLRFLRLPR